MTRQAIVVRGGWDGHVPVAATEEFLPFLRGNGFTVRIELYTEQYWVLADDKNDVLATTTLAPDPGGDWTEPVTAPAVWTRTWGAGRVFVCTVGHDLSALRVPAVGEIIRRGLLWAARA